MLVPLLAIGGLTVAIHAEPARGAQDPTELAGSVQAALRAEDPARLALLLDEEVVADPRAAAQAELRRVTELVPDLSGTVVVRDGADLVVRFAGAGGGDERAAPRRLVVAEVDDRWYVVPTLLG